MTRLLIPLWLLLALCLAAAPDAKPDEGDDAPYKADIPESWLSSSIKPEMRAMAGKPAPGLWLDGFINADGNPAADGSLRDRIVVVDFWATWCGPCLKGIPKMNDLAQKYAPRGVIVLGVCTSSSGQEQMPQTVRQHNILYPVARDPSRRTEAAWNISFYPTYGVVDRNGVLRAMGLSSSRVEDAVEELLKEQPYSQQELAAGRVNAALRAAVRPEWLDGGEDRLAQLKPLLDGSPPAINVDGWVNGRGFRNGLPKGTDLIVMAFVDASADLAPVVEPLNAVHAAHARDGVLVVGVADAASADALAKSARAAKARFALCADVQDQTAASFQVDGRPSIYVLSSGGAVVAADVKPEHLGQTIAALLAAGKDAVASAAAARP